VNLAGVGKFVHVVSLMEKVSQRGKAVAMLLLSLELVSISIPNKATRCDSRFVVNGLM
jgi:hypothetical protein